MGPPGMCSVKQIYTKRRNRLPSSSQSKQIVKPGRTTCAKGSIQVKTSIPVWNINTLLLRQVHPEWVGFYPLPKCPLTRANPWLHDLCKHPSFPYTFFFAIRHSVRSPSVWDTIPPCCKHCKSKRDAFVMQQQGTHFTIIHFIVGINLLSYVRPHMGGHMGQRAIRRVPNLVPNTKLG